jgi:hypothetical protein
MLLVFLPLEDEERCERRASVSDGTTTERFPKHEIERDSAGKPVLDKNGLQAWKPRDIHRGMIVDGARGGCAVLILPGHSLTAGRS